MKWEHILSDSRMFCLGMSVATRHWLTAQAATPPVPELSLADIVSYSKY